MCARAQAAQTLAVARQAIVDARGHCQTLMHEDAVAFTQCADDWLQQHAPRALQLGGSYYAWLACTSAAKNGLPAAQPAALHFLAILRPLQRQLALSDAALCPLIEGDCAARTARMLLMERDGVAASPVRSARLDPR